MKNTLKLILGFVLLAGMFSCKDEAAGPTLKVVAAPTIVTPASSAVFVLQEADAANVISLFEWTAADYNFSAAVTYGVELDITGNNFASPVTVKTTTGLKIEDVTVEQINAILLAKALPTGVASSVDLRIAANVNPDVATVYSNVVTISVTPYETVVEYPKLQVPGSYQGWDPANLSTVIYSLNSDNKYEGYIFFPDADAKYKYTQGLSWDVNWGDDNADGTLEPGGADIGLVNPGMYRLNVDLNALTHTATATNWGLIGSATPTGWDSDTDLTYDAVSGHLTITTDLIVGDIKFRANDDWAINLGDNDGNSTLEQDGANIAIAEAGNYTIELILNEAKPTYSVTKN